MIGLQAGLLSPCGGNHTLSIAHVLFADTCRNIDRRELGPLISCRGFTCLMRVVDHLLQSAAGES